MFFYFNNFNSAKYPYLQINPSFYKPGSGSGSHTSPCTCIEFLHWYSNRAHQYFDLNAFSNTSFNPIWNDSVNNESQICGLFLISIYKFDVSVIPSIFYKCFNLRSAIENVKNPDGGPFDFIIASKYRFKDL